MDDQRDDSESPSGGSDDTSGTEGDSGGDSSGTDGAESGGVQYEQAVIEKREIESPHTKQDS